MPQFPHRVFPGRLSLSGIDQERRQSSLRGTWGGASATCPVMEVKPWSCPVCRCALWGHRGVTCWLKLDGPGTAFALNFLHIVAQFAGVFSGRFVRAVFAQDLAGVAVCGDSWLPSALFTPSRLPSPELSGGLVFPRRLPGSKRLCQALGHVNSQ